MSSRSARAEHGFTLVEVLAACLLLLVGIGGVVATLDRSRDVVSRSEVRQTAIFQAERALEAVRAVPYPQLGLSSAPAYSTDQSSPDHYVRSGNRYQWDPEDASRVSDLVLSGVVPRQTAWDDGRMRGTLYAYVLEYDDPAVAGGSGARRVLVAASVDGPWSPPRPVTVSTVIHDPGATP